jgi:tetratricopeptide (TPR) repeat protein
MIRGSSGPGGDPGDDGMPFRVSEEMTHHEALLDRGYEAMDEGDFEAARAAFHEALEIQPEEAEPHNYIGLSYIEEENFVQAGLEYSAARMLAAQELGAGFATARWWVDPRTRPYLKATLGLARACLYQEQFDQAEKHVNEVLKLNPTDNLGCRYLQGELRLRRGDAMGAAEAFDGAEIGPGSLYSAVLALLASGDARAAVLMMRKAFFSNVFIPPLLIGAKIRTRYRGEAQNRAAEIDARAYERRCGDLWAPRAAERDLLRRVWEDPEVRAENERYADAVDRLSAARDADARDRILEELDAMRGDEVLSRTHGAICARLGI